MFVFSDAPTLMSLPQMRNLRFQFDLHPDKACLSSPVQGIKNVIPQVAPSSHLVLDLLELSQYMWQVRFDKHKKSSFPTCFSHSEYGFHQKTRGRSSLEEEPKNLVFTTDDEWLIDEINMELIRVHKKTRKVKYDPKEGQMPVPLELLDTTCKTIMQFAKNRVVTQEDDWRVTERPLTMQQMKRLFMTEASGGSRKTSSTPRPTKPASKLLRQRKPTMRRLSKTSRKQVRSSASRAPRSTRPASATTTGSSAVVS